MNVKQLAVKILPGFLKTRIIERRRSIEHEKFTQIDQIKCGAKNLRSIQDVSLSDIFHSEQISEFWNESEKELAAFHIPDGTGGVNPGDRRAIYYLISHFSPSSVLEIGTHIGASTLHIASSLSGRLTERGKTGSLITVDIVDVNSEENKPWLHFGSSFSPAEMVKKLNYEPIVTFVKSKSLGFLSGEQKFDFIFLDGDHSSATVYQEIPAALKLLNPNGVILLHDYFPEKKPLWSDGSVKQGPVTATDRLMDEGADLAVLPLGDLPWFTKLHSNKTSLALLLRKSKSRLPE